MNLLRRTTLAVCLATFAACNSPVTQGLRAHADADFAAAHDAWAYAANLGDADAHFLLGTLFERGEGVPVDRERAAHHYTQAAQAGHADAAVNLGALALQAGDRTSAHTWFQRGADAGSPAGMYNLGALLLTAKQPHTQAALDWLTRAARHEHAGAAYLLGLAYLGECGAPADARAALHSMRQAADAGYARAEHVLGTWYLEGRHVTQSAPAAYKWLMRAAQQDLAEAQYLVGWMHHSGTGVAQDHAAALGWMRSAAAQGLASAQTNLGLMLLRGQGTARDVPAAERWLKAAADQGFALAEYNLGLLYTKGLAGSPVTGQALIRRAADQELAVAVSKLSVLERMPSDAALAQANAR